MTRPAGKASEERDSGSSDEGGSPLRTEGGRPQSSFWGRAARLLRPLHGSSLRENLTDALINDAGAGEVFSPEERAMLHNILRFREVRVEDIMVPRADIEAVEQNVSLAELITVFDETGRSRMPVYSETLDDPRGMVHIRDLLSYLTKQARNERRNAAAQTLHADGAAGENPLPAAAPQFDLGRADLSKTVVEAGIIRSVLFVPPSMHASDLMARMQAARTQMALVIDEYGGTDGLVSHEDIVEMVIGDIDDEHDDEEAMFTRVSEDVVIADARVELEEIAEAIGSDFDIADQIEDVDTLGGLIFSALGRIPARGEVVQAVPGFEFHILDADPRRVKRVRIIRKRNPARRRPPKVDPDGQAAASGRPANQGRDEGAESEGAPSEA